MLTPSYPCKALTYSDPPWFWALPNSISFGRGSVAVQHAERRLLQGRGKKDAKQVAAAAVLEMLLANVPESDFLQPGKGKFLKLRVSDYLLKQPRT
jgi:hypothetical protein